MPYRSTEPSPTSLGYARVALARPLPQPYTYAVPESMRAAMRKGSLVRVPLRSDHVEGVVVDLMDQPDTRAPIKPIERHLSPDFALDGELIELGRWIAHYYFCSLGEALATISMIGLNDLGPKTALHYRLKDPDYWLTASRASGPTGERVTAGHQRVITTLLAEGGGPLAAAELRARAAVGHGVLQTMLKRHWLTRAELPVDRDDEENPVQQSPSAQAIPILTDEQETALAELHQALSSGQYRTFLLHGVTGSGKTELYLRTIEQTLRLGRSAVVLVPEIALTPQTVAVFRHRLGSLVGVYHSRMSLGQKYDLWRRITERRVRVVIGARSALFVPVSDPGVFIVDEEHESTYKQSETPRYHARDVAVVRGSRLGAVVLLGSATPSAASLHNAREGKYAYLRLTRRIGPHAAPTMTIVDMKRHLGTAQMVDSSEALISPPLRRALADRLEAGEQSILLLNRRGFANHVLCLKCETSIICPHCDVPMTYHKTVDRLLCHWCGHRMPVPKVCPACEAAEVHSLGLGTQRIEEMLAEQFPAARLLRVDMDSMRRKGAHQAAWDKINNHQVDIILGTQMIAKGLHLERVTLVGVVSADFALFMPDFRAAERTYALLTQVAGRAGRGSTPGEVIVQTFIPHHYAIDAAARLAEAEFYERELHIRRMLRFPPFTRMAALILTDPDADAVRERSTRLANMLKTLTYRPNYKTVQVLGPTPAPIGRLEDQYRWRLLVRSTRVRPLHDLLAEGLAEFHRRVKGSARSTLTIDIDPMDLM